MVDDAFEFERASTLQVQNSSQGTTEHKLDKESQANQ
jgi:hypothetical protein